MAELSKRNVVLLPARAALRETVVRAVESLGGRAVGAAEAETAELAVVDLCAAGGLKALDALKATPAGARLSVIAIVPASGTPPEGLADFVLASAVEAELAPRLLAAQERHAAAAEAQERSRGLSLLLRLTGDYAGATDVAELLHDVTRRLAEEMDIHRASLVLVDEAQGAGFVVAASDDAALKDLRIELSRYPEVREAVRTKKPVLVEDAPTHPLLEGVQGEVAAKGIQNIAAVPVALEGNVLGVLLLRASVRRAAFSEREIDLLTTVAHATAVALRNVNQLERLRGQREEEKSARIAAEERAAALKRYEEYFAHLSDGIAILDRNGTVLSVNPAGLSLFGATADQVLGRHVASLAYPLDSAGLIRLLDAVQNGEVLRADVSAGSSEGMTRTLSVSAAPLRVEGAAAILSMRDVTQARKLADELKKTKEFLERLIDSSVDAIIAADMRGRIILFNKGAESICGYSAEEALKGLNVRSLYAEGKAYQVMANLRGEGHGGRGRLTVTRQEILSKKGELVPVNMTASILYEDGREVATVGIFTDLRDRVQLERKLSDAETRLEESEKNAVIVALAGTAAHELNQPLTSVMGYAELLRRKLKEDEPAFRSVDIIYREAERMAEIVRKIGKITRFETKAYVGAAKILDLEKATSHEE